MAGARILFAGLCATALLGCATPPPQPAAAPQGEQLEPAPEEERTVPPPAPEAPQAAQPEEGFRVSEEVYQTTFAEIEEAIAQITATIAAKDYEGWLSWLTREYVARTGSDAYLAEVSETPVLKKAGTTLRSLRDYFDNVVVPSRFLATLDRIEFVDQIHVKAWTVIREQPVILYYLVREDGKWKIGTW